MPWRDSSPMDLKTQFVADYLRHMLSISELSRQYNRTRDGHYCYPLTVTDNFSRYLLGCQALLSTSCADAKPVFRRLFQEFGLPQRIRSDNGVPFATVSLARLSTLSAWFIRLGIIPELIEPGKPQQNGRHERMHRTLKAEATRPPAANCRSQQRTFNIFRAEFNNQRPHEALALETPASLYQSSPRPFPAKLPPLEYPAHFETRYVSHNGGIRWNCAWVTLALPAPASMSAGRRSTTEFGTCILAR